ncbi:MAG: hypothetical protein H5T97_05935 [Firmicutes bacterium]|nr:hypothetical protein [Bacillota bacterium]
MGTSPEVLQASEQLLRIESRYVEALFSYHLVPLTLEMAGGCWSTRPCTTGPTACWYTRWF